jgi:hypothetical protein
MHTSMVVALPRVDSIASGILPIPNYGLTECGVRDAIVGAELN